MPTYLCADPEQLPSVLDRLDELVLKPVDGYGGDGIVIGPHASRTSLQTLSASRSAPSPHRWVAQELVALSTHPIFDGQAARAQGTSTCARSCCWASGPRWRRRR